MGFLDDVTREPSRTDPTAAAQEYGRLLNPDEQVQAAYLFVRDALLFTDWRLILVDKQGLKGRRVKYHSVPYRSIAHFSVDTGGKVDFSELTISVTGGEDIVKQFGEDVDIIYEVQALLASFVAR